MKFLIALLLLTQSSLALALTRAALVSQLENFDIAIFF